MPLVGRGRVGGSACSRAVGGPWLGVLAGAAALAGLVAIARRRPDVVPLGGRGRARPGRGPHGHRRQVGATSPADPLADRAAEEATVSVVGTVASDPVPLTSARGDQTLWRLRVTLLEADGGTTRLVAPVLVFVPRRPTARRSGRPCGSGGGSPRPTTWTSRPCSSPATGPRCCDRPTSGGEAPRPSVPSLRDSVSHRPPEQRALVPALVVGDDSGLPTGARGRLPDDRADAPARGLGHEPDPGRRVPAGGWRAGAGSAGRWLAVVGAAGIVGFVLLARTEPSVLRAAVMGTVALVGLGHDGRRRGLRGPGRRGPGPGAARSAAGRGGGLRALRARDRGDPGPGPRDPRRARPVAPALAGRGGRGAAGRPARLHAGRGRDLRTGEPGRGRRQCARGPGGRAGHRARAGGWAGRAWSGRRWAGSPAASPAGVSPGWSPWPSAAPTCRPLPSAGAPARSRWAC